MPGEGGVEDHDVDAVDVDAVDVDVVDVEHLGAHVCTSFPRPVSRLSTTAEQERGIIALCIDTKRDEKWSKCETYVNPEKLAIPLLPLSFPSFLQRHLPAAALVRAQPQPGEILVSKFSSFWNTSIVHPPLTKI